MVLLVLLVLIEVENATGSYPNYALYINSNFSLIQIINPLTHGPRANQPYKFKMPNAQKILKWDKSHTLFIPLQVHLV